MPRNDDLLRHLMLDLEQARTVVTDQHAVPGHSRDEVAYHLALILRSGWAEGVYRYPRSGPDSTVPQTILVRRLLPAGHDFLANVRDDDVWAKAKQVLGKVGGSASLEIVAQVITAIVRGTLGLGIIR
ncbi:MAG: DUF2513 domain-containing protein [Luteibacter sp.]|uniref:DUF2513 domain-containing protein n=1 Tax=Luteibacter sp. TaxID=1886636 RepID=UPI00280A2538|nr:DUF2513 domain-containing protein [Luteibacter sp.]MDQ7995225.1 DUF2513 domain-containing protein [Luteibacter sp.]